MLKQTIALLTLSFALMMGLQAQKFFTKTGTIDFLSDTPMEKIEAKNEQVISIIDTEKGEVAFSVLMKGFNFEKALMQEHFNEKYVESDKYPKASFKGNITNFDEIDFSKSGTYTATVSGIMEMHGQSKEIESTGELQVLDGKIHATSTFELVLADFNIEIPKVVRDNIAESVTVKVDMNYEPYNK